MTKKDYIRAAEMIRDDYGSNKNLAAAFARFFAGDNSSFDEERFLEACEPERPRRR